MFFNPYDQNVYKPKTVRIDNKKKKKDFNISLNNYRFELELSSNNANRLLLLTTGYLGTNNNNDNTFLLNDNDLDKLIEQLIKYRDIIRKSKNTNVKIEALHGILNKYLDNGYVQHINMIYKPVLLPPGFNSVLYKPFIIKPIIKQEYTDLDDVDKDFEFLEIFHLDIVEESFDMIMDYIRNYNDIPIHIYGWDYNEEVDKRKKEAIKDLDKETKRRKNKKLIEKEKAKFEEMLQQMNGGILSSKNIKK